MLMAKKISSNAFQSPTRPPKLEKTFVFRMTNEDHEILKKLATTQKLEMVEVVRAALGEYASKHSA